MHKPVLLEELVDLMSFIPGGTYVDCTGGGGGHAYEAIKKIGDDGRLIIIDRDEDAFARLSEKFYGYKNVTVLKGNYADVDILLGNIGIKTVNGLYADFGVSNYQIENGDRGFSFRREGPLDMRMDRTSDITAYDVVNSYSVETIQNILKKYGEEPFAYKIALLIHKRRSISKIKTTTELADIIASAIPKKLHKPGTHPATRSFQALRIFINKELEGIESLLKKIESLIMIGGRSVFISFHSLEDRLVKDILGYYAKTCVCDKKMPVCICGKKQTFKLITKKPVIPTEVEIKSNPLSRSAKLRCGERVNGQ